MRGLETSQPCDVGPYLALALVYDVALFLERLFQNVGLAFELAGHRRLCETVSKEDSRFSCTLAISASFPFAAAEAVSASWYFRWNDASWVAPG